MLMKYREGSAYAFFFLVQLLFFLPFLIFQVAFALQLGVLDLTSFYCFLARFVTVVLLLLEFMETDADVGDGAVLGEVELFVSPELFARRVGWGTRCWRAVVDGLDAVACHAIGIWHGVRVGIDVGGVVPGVVRVA